jgi:hypothetical protein
MYVYAPVGDFGGDDLGMLDERKRIFKFGNIITNIFTSKFISRFSQSDRAYYNNTCGLGALAPPVGLSRGPSGLTSGR